MIAHREAIHEGKRSNTINTYTEEDDVDDPPQNDIDENDYASTRVESKTDNPEFIANRLKDLDQEGYVDVSEKKIKKEIWSHFLVNEILGVAICKYCLRKFKLNKKNTNWNFGDGMLKHLKFHCKKRPKLIDGIGSAEESKSRRTPEELDLEGFVDISDQKENENWSHFLVKESIGIALCKYCQRKFKTVITNIHLHTERISEGLFYFIKYPNSQ